MNIKNILIILSINHIAISETPKLICLPQKPFQTDSNCGDFNDVCVKKDDLQCNNFQAACKQCPPTNYTVFMLLHLNGQLNRSNFNQKKIKNQISISNSQINVSLNKIVKKSTDQVRTLVGIGALCLIFILLNFIFNIFIFLKDKFCKKKKRREESSNESQYLISNQSDTQLLKEIKKLNYENDDRLQTIINKNIQLLDKINHEKEYSTLEPVVCYKLRFQITNHFHETELIVSKFDNIIKLKKSICDRNMNMNDYKRMIMKYKGVTLDNNQYLLSCINSTNIPIFCEFDNNVDVNAIIVIKLKCDNIYPEMLQIWKHQQIKDLKNIVSKLNKTNEDLLIFYKSTQLDDDDKTIDEFKIEDNDWLQVVNNFGEMQKIVMKSIFTAKETISIEFSKFEKVSSIINKSIQKIQHKMATNDLVIFLNKKLLENDKFIYEYNIDSKSLVEFCYFKSSEENKDNSGLPTYGHIKLFKMENIDRQVLHKAYDKRYMEIAHENNLSLILKKDFHMFQITKYHPRFIQLFGIYIGTTSVFIEMENFTTGSLKSFLLSNNEISTYQISKWAYQILDGLKHLHDNNIILKDLNTTDIMIDGNIDVKLPSFNMTEYLNHLDDDSFKHRDGVLTYVAPEILESEPYEANVDVWSLGVIMIEVAKRAQLFPRKSESQIVQKIKESHTIEYDKTNIPADLINFIDCCVKGDPKERAKIDQLMKHEFIENYL